MKISTKCLILCSILCMVGLCVYAVPACPSPFTITQPNGTSLTLQAKGDETFNYITDMDGYVVEQKDGIYSYLLKESNGTLKRNSSFANSNVRPQNAVRQSELPVQKQIMHTPALIADSGNSGTTLLTVLVEFTDQKLSNSYSDSFWSELMYSETKKSVNKYYKEVSIGKHSVSPAAETYNTANDGVVKVSLNIPHPEPQKASSSTDENERILSIVHNALAAADPYVNFSNYDKDNNKYITNDEMVISFVVAGYEAAVGGNIDKSVWAHQWSNILSKDINCDGVHLLRSRRIGSVSINGTYIMQGELLKFSTAVGVPVYPLSIGTLCHELGHTLGLPDLYNTKTNEPAPTPEVGYFSLMASGSWGFLHGEISGTTPVHLDAWCKTALGWVTPTVINPKSDKDAHILNAQSNGNYNVYKILTSDPNEYFLVENRQFEGYDASMSQLYNDDGVAIWHIDNDIISEYGNINQINSAGHKMGIAIEAQAYESNLLYPFWAVANSQCAVFDKISSPNSDLNSPVGTSDISSGVKITVNSPSARAMTFFLNYSPADAKIDETPNKTTALFKNNSPRSVTAYPIVAVYRQGRLVETQTGTPVTVAGGATSAPITLLNGAKSPDYTYKFLFWDGLNTMIPLTVALQ